MDQVKRQKMPLFTTGLLGLYLVLDWKKKEKTKQRKRLLLCELPSESRRPEKIIRCKNFADTDVCCRPRARRASWWDRRQDAYIQCYVATSSRVDRVTYDFKIAGSVLVFSSGAWSHHCVISPPLNYAIEHWWGIILNIQLWGCFMQTFD